MLSVLESLSVQQVGRVPRSDWQMGPGPKFRLAVVGQFFLSSSAESKIRFSPWCAPRGCRKLLACKMLRNRERRLHFAAGKRVAKMG